MLSLSCNIVVFPVISVISRRMNVVSCGPEFGGIDEKSEIILFTSLVWTGMPLTAANLAVGREDRDDRWCRDPEIVDNPAVLYNAFRGRLCLRTQMPNRGLPISEQSSRLGT